MEEQATVESAAEPADVAPQPRLAARGESQPHARASNFSPYQGAKPQAYWSISRISQRRDGGKGPLAARLDFCHGLLGRILAEQGHLLALVALVVVALGNHIAWIQADHSPFPKGDCYILFNKLLAYMDGRITLEVLSHEGRPPLYSILTIPFIYAFGRSEDGALYVNMAFTALLIISTYKIGLLAKNRWTGLLAAFLVVTYPPIIHGAHWYYPKSAALPACAALFLWRLVALVKSRSSSSCWLLGLALGFGALIHPTFLFVAAVPTLVFGLYVLLFQRQPRLPQNLRDSGSWLLSKLRRPIFVRGLLPAAVITLALALPWYLTRGLEMIEVKERLAKVAQATAGKPLSVGFHKVESHFWWYALTAPGAISFIMAGLVVAAILLAVFKRQESAMVFVVTLAGTYTALSTGGFGRSWVMFACVLPAVASMTAWLISSIRHRGLRRLLASIGLATGIFNFYFVLWGGPSWYPPVARTLGAPGWDRLYCQRSAVFCPSPPERGAWPMQEIEETILKDPTCRRRKPCRLAMVNMPKGLSAGRLRTHLRARQVEDRLALNSASSTGWRSRFVPPPYNYAQFLKSDYVLYPALPSDRRGNVYSVATERFLHSPPPSYVASHRKVASFQCPNGETLDLFKRVRKLGVAEAEAAVAAMPIQGKYTSKKYELLAELNAAEGNHQAAEAYLNQATESGGRDAAREVLIGQYKKLGQSDNAIALFKSRLKSKPENVAARIELAKLYRKQGDVEAALAVLEEGANILPESAWLRRELAGFYKSQKNYELAIRYYRETLDLTRGDIAAQVGLAESYRSAGDSGAAKVEYEAAAKLYRDLLEDKPRETSARIRLAEVYRKLGRPGDAIRELETAIQSAPRESWPHRALADVYSHQKQLDQAVSSYQRALELDPKDIVASVRLAGIYRKKGDFDAAVAELQRGIAQNPDNTWARHELARFYRRMKRRDLMIATYEQILAIDESDSVARKALGRR